MQKTNSYKDLIVWQRSMELAREVYKITTSLPHIEQYGLVSQLRRATVSIPSNLAEGSKRGSRKDFMQFLRIASGSAAELETQLMLSKDLYPEVPYTKVIALLDEVQRMLTSLIKSLK